MAESAPDPIAQIPRPLEVREDEVVRLVYPMPDSGEPGAPDERSVTVAVRYLEDRHADDPRQYRRHVFLADTAIPASVYVPAGESVTRYSNEKAPGWWIRPAVAVGATALSILAVNGPPAAAWVRAKIAQIEYQPTPPRDVPIEIPGKTVRIFANAASPDTVGSFAVNDTAIAEFRSQIVQDEDKGGQVEVIHDNASTSDEFGPEASIAVRSVDGTGNAKLGQQRENAVLGVLKRAFGGNLPAPVDEAAREHVISKGLKAKLERLANKFGFADIVDAIHAVDAGQPVNARLRAAIVDNFTKWRGVKLSATVRMPGKEIPSVAHIKGVDNPPPGPKGWIPWGIPVFPLRRRKLVRDTAPNGRFALVPAFNIPWPAIYKEDRTKRWMRLLKEAEQPDGSLPRFAWAYSRKYLHLLRDDRIPLVMRTRYAASGGEERTAYTLFVDHYPSDEAVDLVSEELAKCAAMEKVRLGDKISAIAIHPSDQAGKSPDHPERIGPGVDKQYGEDTLGVTIPLLRLAEMHMPAGEQNRGLLAAALAKFGEAPDVTLAHEVAGHGNFIVDGMLKVVRARHWRIRNARVPERDQFRHDFAALDYLKRLPSGASGRTSDPLPEFDIEYQEPGGDGSVKHARVTAKDPRLGQSIKVTIRDHRITKYAGTDDLEHAAETIASVSTGKLPPLKEAGAAVPPQDEDSDQFAQGYHADPAAAQAATEFIGGDEDSLPVTFENGPEVHIDIVKPEEDPFLADLMAMARSRRFPKRQREMIAILAGVAEHRHSAQDEFEEAA